MEENKYIEGFNDGFLIATHQMKGCTFFRLPNVTGKNQGANWIRPITRPCRIIWKTPHLKVPEVSRFLERKPMLLHNRRQNFPHFAREGVEIGDFTFKLRRVFTRFKKMNPANLGLGALAMHILKNGTPDRIVVNRNENNV
jgi:hypothetical protein